MTLAFGISAQSVHRGAFPRRCGCAMMIHQPMTMEKAVEEVALRRTQECICRVNFGFRCCNTHMVEKDKVTSHTKSTDLNFVNIVSV